MTNPNTPQASNEPAIPNKRYFTIGEVGQLCGVKPHVLRYWEQEFTELKPCKRRGNRRYYQRDDVLMVRQIRSLLYEQGYTIGGARQRLGQWLRGEDLPPEQSASDLAGDQSETINEVITELEDVLLELTEA